MALVDAQGARAIAAVGAVAALVFSTGSARADVSEQAIFATRLARYERVTEFMARLEARQQAQEERAFNEDLAESSRKREFMLRLEEEQQEAEDQAFAGRLSLALRVQAFMTALIHPASSSMAEPIDPARAALWGR